MSQWVDFGLYALQAVLLWIVVPAWVANGLRSTLRRIVPWVRFLQAWGVLSVLALLRARGWEGLLKASNVMLAVGLLITAYGLWRFLRGLKAGAPQGAAAAAQEMFPLTRDEFVPRGLRYLAYALLVCALAARPIAGLLWPGRVRDVWGNLFTGLVIALLLFFAAAGSVMRAPNQLDQALGERYRRMEVGICYLLMGNLALLEMAGLLLELTAAGSRRHVALLVSGFVSITLVGLLLVASRPRRPPPPVESEAVE